MGKLQRRTFYLNEIIEDGKAYSKFKVPAGVTRIIATGGRLDFPEQLLSANDQAGRLTNPDPSSILSGISNNCILYGAGSSGQLGNNTTTAVSTPVTPNLVGNIRQVVCGSATYLLLDDGQLYSTGSNTFGQLGNNSTISASNPVAVLQGQRKFRYVQDVGAAFIAIDDRGHGWACGNNGNGRLGINQATSVSVSNISPIAGNRRWLKFSRTDGDSTVLGIELETGHVYGWGYNAFDALLQGSVASSITSPVLVTSNIRFKDIALTTSASTIHALGIDINGMLWTWGNNELGQLGINTTNANQSPVLYSSPIRVSVNEKFRSVATGNGSSFAIDEFNRLWVWGRNNNGQLGLGDTVDRSSPTLNPIRLGVAGSFVPVYALNAAGQTSMIISGAYAETDPIDPAINFNRDRAAGFNNNGQLGDNSTTTKSSFTSIDISGLQRKVIGAPRGFDSRYSFSHVIPVIPGEEIPLIISRDFSRVGDKEVGSNVEYIELAWIS